MAKEPIRRVMRILVVENKSEDAGELREAVLVRCSGAEVIIAASRDSARSTIDTGRFDLLICDLSIPTSDGDLDEDPTHGWDVLAHCKAIRPGTPTCVLTGTRSDDQPARVLEYGDQLDLFGKGTPEPAFQFFRKDQISECLDYVERVSKEREELCKIEVTQPEKGPGLDQWEKRVIQVFCRRIGAALARTSSMGGLSESRVIGLSTQDSRGRSSRIVARITDREEVMRETEGYRNYLTGVLPGHAFVSLADSVLCGAGGLSGAFYELADGFDRTLFEVLMEDEGAAVEAVRSLQEDLSPWSRSGRKEHVSTREIRRISISDSQFDSDDVTERLSLVGEDNSLQTLEEKSPLVHWCPGHRDLHGANILVSQDLTPILIDFGDLGESTAALDPIVLELSLLFHPGARAICGDWPTVENALSWPQLDSYLQGCPVPQFVRACRRWANDVATGNREVLVTAYAHSLRQLKYPNTPHQIARAIVRSTVDAALGDY